MDFSKLKVVEIASVLAGPAVGMFFSELGAEVIKIENKKENGDITRKWKLPTEDTSKKNSAYFSSVNYKKKSILLDFNDQKDQAIVKEHIKNCDVLILNFKPKDYIKFQLTFEEVVHLNPKIIYAKISGFPSGDERVAYDLVLQAESGWMYMNGEKNSIPTKIPVAIVDLFAAHQLKQGILVALLQNKEDHLPKKVEVSLFESAIASLANQASNYLMEDHIPQRQGSLHPNIAPYGEQFTSKDGVLFTLAIGSDRQFEDLLTVLKIENQPNFISNSSRIENRQELQEILQKKISTMEILELKAQFIVKNIPFGIIKNLAQVFEEKTAQKMVLDETIDGEITKRVKSIAFTIN